MSNRPPNTRTIAMGILSAILIFSAAIAPAVTPPDRGSTTAGLQLVMCYYMPWLCGYPPHGGTW